MRKLTLILAAITVDYAVSLWADHSWAIVLPVVAVTSAAVLVIDWYADRRQARRR